MLTSNCIGLLASVVLVASPLTPPAAEESASVPAMAQGGNNPPMCVSNGNITVDCQGAQTVVTVDGSASFDPEGGMLTFQWSACPGALIVDPTNPVTQIVLDTSSTCAQTCGVRLRVSDTQGLFTVCRLFIEVLDAADGCSPGYWKNHAQSWGPTGFAPTDDFDTVFGVDAFQPNKTLMEALRTGGGGINKLGRMSTAALLNASHSGVAFPRTLVEVLDDVHDAITSGQYEPLATALDTDNNLGCPLN